MKVAGTAVEGARDRWEEVALLFAAQAQDQARALTELQGLDAAMAALAPRIQQAEEQLRAATSARDALLTDYALAKDVVAGPFTKSASAYRAACIVGALVFVVLTVVVFPPTGLRALACGAGFFFVKSKVASEEQAKTLRLTAMYEEGQAHEAQVGSASQSHGAMVHEHQALSERRGALQIGKTVSAVGRVYLPFVPLELAGYPVVVDGTGATSPTNLRLPDLSANASTLDRVKATIAAANNAPILLRAAGNEPSSVDAIHGEEADLASAIDEFGDMLASVPVLSADAPLVHANSPVLTSLRAPLVAKSVPGAVVRGDEAAIREALTKVQRYTEAMRGIGKDVESALRTVRDDLKSTLQRYGTLRDDAMEGAHQHLHSVLARSDLAYVTYYCPRCNRVPQYLFRRLGIEIDKAHEMNPNDLLRALQEDEEARQRIVSDEGLLGELGQIWNALLELNQAIGGWHAQHAANAAAVGDLRAAQANEARLKALRSQEEQLLQQFRSVLRKIVTGNPRPVLELSRQARLHLDPDTGEWQCPLCELVVDDPEVARMGRLLKIKDELLMPMWNTLWTEKDDFRKSELFRTNEQIQRLVEKEVGALRDVSEQYRADMRPVRENLILATTQAVASRSQLEAAVNSLSALGVIDEARAKSTMARLGNMTGGDLDNLKKRAEAKETMLNQEPQAQMSRRVMAIDPIGVLMSPEQLFREQEAAAERPRLPESTESQP